MADFPISGNMKVSTLKERFKAEFGSTLRVYKGNSKHFADDEATVGSLAEATVKQGTEVKAHGRLLVRNFENQIRDQLGFAVQVASPDNSFLVDNNMSLAESGRPPQKDDKAATATPAISQTPACPDDKRPESGAAIKATPREGSSDATPGAILPGRSSKVSGGQETRPSEEPAKVQAPSAPENKKGCLGMLLLLGAGLTLLAWVCVVVVHAVAAR
ncbi:MAG: hypothetical protein A3K19_24920 [Lentisphaerae bacterium RIFOXYB12_FULL_65_16]|nr:MAG: hypothetical protein A3K18_24850 [Lentisphaerae bacterium RIFOXYA12_64_32]OGV90713.1 MAG: hypothetical protein A3K19_24920 [Lentisphaerae bacterium RIFOXYB12_FULL_65_16]